MLPIVGELNKISPELRKKLNDEYRVAGKVVKYKFYIAHKNPDGQHKQGEDYIFPMLYTLTPVVFFINDGEERKRVKIGLYDTTIRDKDVEEQKFNRVTLRSRDEGVLTLDMEQREHQEIFEYLELHPKNENGFFRDKNIPALFCRMDELKEAKQRLKTKEMRGQAMMVATRMTEQETRNFAASMNWNQFEDYEILKDRMIEIADKDPEFFRKSVEDPAQEYKAVVKMALDANILAWQPVECRYVWGSNNSLLVILDRGAAEKPLDGLADWLMTAKNGPDAYKKIKALLTPKASS